MFGKGDFREDGKINNGRERERERERENKEEKLFGGCLVRKGREKKCGKAQIFSPCIHSSQNGEKIDEDSMIC